MKRMTPEEQVHYHAWKIAMIDMESEVMRFAPTLIGGRKPGEDCIDYTRRGRALADVAIAKLIEARKQFDKVKP